LFVKDAAESRWQNQDIINGQTTDFVRLILSAQTIDSAGQNQSVRMVAFGRRSFGGTMQAQK